MAKRTGRTGPDKSSGSGPEKSGGTGPNSTGGTGRNNPETTGRSRTKRQASVQDYRHDDAKRTNNPPAKIAAEGVVPAVPKATYAYSPRRPPTLRFDPSPLAHARGSDQRSDARAAVPADLIPPLIEEAGQRPLTPDEQQLLADALRNYHPWLEWAGKAEQDREGHFAVDPVALHIHERVSAQAILKVAKRQNVERDLFGDPQLDYHQAVQFYRHDVDWTNRLILGDSLQVMSSLAHRENLAGKVQMIYIDPPYGIKFASNFQPEVGRRDVKDKEQDLTREPEMVKAYRDTWHLGIHSYLSYLRDRLIVARELLADTGSIFVQISDENLHRVRQVMDEVFGTNNSLGLICFKKVSAMFAGGLPTICDFILWYSRDREQGTYHQLFDERNPTDETAVEYRFIQYANGERCSIPVEDLESLDEHDVVFRPAPLTSQGATDSGGYTYAFEGREFAPGVNRHWSTTKDGMNRLAPADRLIARPDSLGSIRYLDDYPAVPKTNIWMDTSWGFAAQKEKAYVVQTHTEVIARCMLMTTDPGDLVLDPTCGSGTTAYVAEQWGRRWITIDTSRVSIAIARQRLLTAKYERFRVKGEDKEGNGNGNHRPGVDPHPGFIYKTVPHITLKSIAQNTNLDPIFARHEPILEARLAACNKALKKVSKELRVTLEAKLLRKQKEKGKNAVTDADRRRWLLPPENRADARREHAALLKASKKSKYTVDLDFDGWYHWEVPFDTDPDWPEALQDAVTEYRKAWRDKMDEVNACIAENASHEELVDKPEAVRNIVRVSGPFTVEAVEPPEMSLGDVLESHEAKGEERHEGTEARRHEGEADPSRDREGAATRGSEGLFGGEPEALSEGFESRALRMVETRVDQEAQNIEAYLDQMLRYLRLDGVRFPNNKQLKFTRLDRLESATPGLYAEGRWVPDPSRDREGADASQDDDPDGRALVCVAIGPQYGPVTAKMIEDCIRSANRMGFDDLVVAGFSFDGTAQAVIDEVKHSRLRVHAAHIRPDVNPGMNGLLKQQPGSQLFTVFGQPRTRVDGPDESGEYTVTMEGVDIYDPVTNEIRSTGADKVAAWFIDGDYDGRTFCITQAFFPDRSAWDKLARALKDVIDAAAFEAFSGTVSLPFPAGTHKCVAVKVIDPRGNEVMTVQRV